MTFFISSTPITTAAPPLTTTMATTTGFMFLPFNETSDPCDSGAVAWPQELADGGGGEGSAGVNWTYPSTILSVLALVALIVAVVVGNMLVIIAVATSAQLRSPTHLFVSSLAVADLLVGITVLPFSATLQLTGRWHFGRVWCSVWLAVDVWMCTASILNLCAISMDRYLAISRPVFYLTQMSTRKARRMCALVWLLAFVIALPPLIARTDNLSSRSSAFTVVRNHSSLNTNSSDLDNAFNSFDVPLVQANSPLDTSPSVRQRTCARDQCALINERGYVVYSALGSFFVPCLVMVFFYWRIYRTAVNTTLSIRQGFRTIRRKKIRRTATDSGTTQSTRCNQEQMQEVTLRIHRGRPSSSISTISRHRSERAHSELQSRSQQHIGADIITNSNCTRDGDRPTRCQQTPNITPKRTPNESVSCHMLKPAPDTRVGSIIESSSAPEGNLVLENESARSHSANRSTKRGTCSADNTIVHAESSDNESLSTSTHAQSRFRHQLQNQQQQQEQELQEQQQEEHSGQHRGNSSRLNLRSQARRFRVETRAAKTLAIIIGIFVLCWLPFFSMYLLRPFCSHCVTESVFQFTFWLGYCNSAMNPVLYTCLSLDFRNAFRRIVCRVMCCRKVSSADLVQQHIAQFRDEHSNRVNNHRLNSFGVSNGPTRKPYNQVVISLHKLCESSADKPEQV